jgi:hypothetical protein
MRTATRNRRVFRPDLNDGLQALPSRLLLSGTTTTVNFYLPQTTSASTAPAYSVTYSSTTTTSPTIGPVMAPTCSEPIADTTTNDPTWQPTCSTPT